MSAERALYIALHQRCDNVTFHGRYRATEDTAGPWDPRHQHGGPPAALLTGIAESLPGGSPDSLIVRASLDILGPIPVGEVEVDARIARPGSRVSLVEATMTDGARPCARLTAWRMRRREVAVPAHEAPPAPTHAGKEVDFPFGWGGGFLDAVRWRLVEGGLTSPGPCTVWTELVASVVAGEEPSGTQRVIAVADAGSGVSALADPRELVFINTELTVHFHRVPTGTRMWMSAQQVLGAQGVGLVRTTLGDEVGAVGAGAQALLLEPR